MGSVSALSTVFAGSVRWSWPSSVATFSGASSPRPSVRDAASIDSGQAPRSQSSLALLVDLERRKLLGDYESLSLGIFAGLLILRPDARLVVARVLQAPRTPLLRIGLPPGGEFYGTFVGAVYHSPSASWVLYRSRAYGLRRPCLPAQRQPPRCQIERLLLEVRRR